VAYAKAGTQLVHRQVLQNKLGRILGRTEFACHSCDVPACINPEHLWVGSHADNMGDAARKKRLSGPKRPHSRARPSECKRGHALTGENTHTRKNGTRVCLECEALRQKVYYQNRKARRQ
jgi:hypothetical protein